MSDEYHFHAVNVMEQVDRVMARQTALKLSPQATARHIADMARGYEEFARHKGQFDRAVHWQCVADYAEERAK